MLHPVLFKFIHLLYFFFNFAANLQVFYGGYRGGSPPPFRPGNPALSGSHPLVIPCYCRLRDLLCFVFISVLIVFLGYLCTAFVPSVLWYCWLCLLICKTVAQITYTVLVETLNPAQSINLCFTFRYIRCALLVLWLSSIYFVADRTWSGLSWHWRLFVLVLYIFFCFSLRVLFSPR